MVASYRKRKKPTLSQMMKKSWWVLFVLVVFFTVLYTVVVFKPEEVAEDLRKGGAFYLVFVQGKPLKRNLLGTYIELV